MERQGDLEILHFTLADSTGQRYLKKVVVPGLCLDHGADEPAHISGDTIELHRETVIVELPAKAKASHVEVARATVTEDTPQVLAKEALSADKFTDSGAGKRYHHPLPIRHHQRGVLDGERRHLL